MSDAVELVMRLRDHIDIDHTHECLGRKYYCDCGRDIVTEGLLEMAAAEIERLRAALRIFADDENWRFGRRFDPYGSRFDGTAVAQAALASAQTTPTHD